MWSKLSHALKPGARNEDSHLLSQSQSLSQSESNSQQTQAAVMSSVYEQHPNLSVFHDTVPEVPFPNASPPSSPSKHGRRGMFKRISKMPWAEDGENGSPLKLPLPKKVRSVMNLNGNGSDASLTRPSIDSIRQSQDTLRRDSHDSTKPPYTPIDNTNKFGSIRSILRDRNTPGTGQSVRFFSRDALKIITPDQSAASEHEDVCFADRLQRVAPGQAGAGATPPHSASSSIDVFSPPRVSLDTSAKDLPATPTSVNSTSLMLPMPPPNLSNLFDMSMEHELPTIPVNTDNAPLLDSAIELDESVSMEGSISMEETALREHDGMTELPLGDPVEISTNTNSRMTPFRNLSMSYFTAKSSGTPPQFDRSQSFSFGQTVFHSLKETSPTTSESSDRSAVSLPTHLESVDLNREKPLPAPVFSRGRAVSDTAFQNMLQSSSTPPKKASVKLPIPEFDIDDPSTAVVALARPEPDPFSAGGNTYYTPQTGVPPTPPPNLQPTHARKTSREEDLIWSLRTQLALQQEMCSQYEVDLKARDELVDVLNEKLEITEKEGEKRKGVLRGWKKKVAELERCMRYLEEEVERSRQDSMERSVMDEASGEALRQLHRQIAKLEGEKKDVEKREEVERVERERAAMRLKEVEEECERLRDECKGREERGRILEEGIREANEQMAVMGRGESARGCSDQVEEEERERQRVAEGAWEQERAALVAQVEDLQEAKNALADELEDVKEQLATKDEGLRVLKDELEAQWKNTEVMSEKIERLENDRDGLREERDRLQEERSHLEEERNQLQDDLQALEERVSGMEVDFNDGENRKNELENEVQEAWNAKEEAEKERDELDEQLRAEQEHTQGLTDALQEREDQVSRLDEERQYALDTVTRLEENIRRRDAEVEECNKRILEREAESEQLREEITKLNREHTRLVEGETRYVQDAAMREGEARQQLEMMVQEKAEADVKVKTLNERVEKLTEEIEKLRRTVHELQLESADKEMKIAQLTKQRSQDKEDLNGLNIALDSKQQELELVKRKLGVRGTAGSTPAANKIAPHRRESSIFSTPGAARPPSALSDREKERPGAATPSTGGKIGSSTLGKSVRTNGTASTMSSTSSTNSATPKLPRVEGAMGPPPSKRSSVAGTPTPTASRIASGSSTLSRSSSAKPPPVTAPPSAFHRRASSAVPDPSKLRSSTSRTAPSPSPSDREEKENKTPAAKRRSSISVAVPA